MKTLDAGMTETTEQPDARVIVGDCREVLRDMIAAGKSVDCCVTSPPYFGLRDYNHEGQIGAERSIAEYVETLRETFALVRDVLSPTGTLWLNLGDSWNRYPANRGASASLSKNSKMGQVESGYGLSEKSLKPNNRIGMPWRVAFALQADGWLLRQDIIWSKPNPMPESVKNRCTASHEYVFLLARRPGYYFDGAAIAEASMGREKFGNRRSKVGHLRNDTERNDMTKTETRNARSVWRITAGGVQPERHPATFPLELASRCILAGCPPGGTVLDPFLGSGTTARAALDLGRSAVGIELNAEYVRNFDNRCAQMSLGALET
jgi:DNA modification methylase